MAGSNLVSLLFIRRFLSLFFVLTIGLGLSGGALHGKGKPADPRGGGGGGNNGGGGGGGGETDSGGSEPLPALVEIISTTVDEIFSDGGGPYGTDKSAKTLAELDGANGNLILDTNTSKRSGAGRTMVFSLARGLLQDLGIEGSGGDPEEILDYSPDEVELTTDADLDLRTIAEGQSAQIPILIHSIGSQEFWLSYGDASGSEPVLAHRENAFTWILTGSGPAGVQSTDSAGEPDFGLHDVSFAMRLTLENPPPPEPILIFREAGYHHLALAWDDQEAWDQPWLIQRSTSGNFADPTDLTHNQAADNTGNSTFRWLGINADNYTDIDGLAENTTYHYRVAVCTNLSEHYQTGATPLFNGWIHGSATTTSLEEPAKQVYDVTQPPYSAIPGDGLNDYPAILQAMTDAEAAGGGIIFMPGGAYDLWPFDPDVELVNGIPTIEAGESATGALFHVTAPNIAFVGEETNGIPTTHLNSHLWHKTPATQWLEVLSAGPGSPVADVRRYFVWLVDAENFTLRNLEIDMGAPPVDTGKEWYTIDEARYQWDVSHKLVANFGNPGMRNVIIDSVKARNCRGEVIYNGGGGEKILIKDSEFSRTNSSTISGSFDLELVNTVIRDSANAAVESALFNDKVSGFTGNTNTQNHIARGCTFIGLDQSAEGYMKDLPGKKNFGGWLCFNEENTYQTVTDSEFRDCLYAAFGPWYEYRNGMRFNCTFREIPGGYAGHLVYTWTSGKAAYQLDGGMSEILWLGDSVHVTKNWPNHQVFFYSQPGEAALDSESPWIWEAVHFTNTGGPHQLNRLWVDTWWLESGRQEAVWKDWTKDPDLSFDPNYLTFTNSNHIDPTYINFFGE